LRCRRPNSPGTTRQSRASHQYEAAEYWYKPSIREFAEMVSAKVSAGDRSPVPVQPEVNAYRDVRMYAKPLSEMRPTLPRTQKSYARTLKAFAAAAEEFLRW